MGKRTGSFGAWALGLTVALGAGACGGKAANQQQVDNGGTAGSAGAVSQVGGGGSGTGGSGATGGSGVTSDSGGPGVGAADSGGTDEGGSAGSGGDAGVVGGDAFDMQGQLTLKGTPRAEFSNCDKFTFTLGLSESNGQLLAITGRDGEASVITLEQDAQGRLTSGSQMLSLNASSACASTHVKVSGLVLTREAHQLVGTASGSVEFSGGDYYVSNDIDLQLTGTPDITPPTLQVPTAPLNPLDYVRLVVSEPLASANIMLEGTPSVPFAGAKPEAGLIALTTAAVLPFSATWTLSGAGKDFAGLDLQVGQTLKTDEDPGLFAQDGFEGPLHAKLAGAAALLDATTTIKAPAGNQALLVKPGSSATLHLQRQADQKTLAFTIIALSSVDTPGFAASQESAMVGVIGGTQRLAVPWTAADGAATGDASWPLASAPFSAKVTLSDVGNDVVVRFAPWTCPGGVCPPQAALLIDDLRIE